MTFAAIDIGTNSIRLLIESPDGRELSRQMRITRLGQGVDATSRLDPAAMSRTVQVLEDYAKEMRTHGVDHLRMTATSAARDASNRDEFFSAVQGAVGQAPELLPGDEEARLSFLGATASLQASGERSVVFDIGGGSTEFACGSNTPEAFISLDIGSVRITERFLHSDPPTAPERASAVEHVLEQLARAERVISNDGARWVGVAGTVSTFAAAAAGIDRYDPSVTHGFTLARDALNRIAHELFSVPTAQRAALIMEPARAEVIVGGAIVLQAIYELFGLEQITVSERDILDGLVASLRPNVLRDPQCTARSH